MDINSTKRESCYTILQDSIIWKSSPNMSQPVVPIWHLRSFALHGILMFLGATAKGCWVSKKHVNTSNFSVRKIMKN